MRLIDADALLNLPFEKMIHTDYGDTCVPIEEIERAPTVDPVKVEVTEIHTFAKPDDVSDIKFGD